MNASTSGSGLHLGVIVGSVREGRFADMVVRWALPELRRLHPSPIDLIDLRTAGIPCGCASSGTQPPPGTPEFSQRIADADAFIFVVPEYNHSFPGFLKVAIDSASDEWKAKPAGFVSYGGQSGGVRAVEQLRLVLAELNVVGTRHTVSFAHAAAQFDDRGFPLHSERAARALGRMYRELDWWAQTLKAARLGKSYVDWL